MGGMFVLLATRTTYQQLFLDIIYLKISILVVTFESFRHVCRPAIQPGPAIAPTQEDQHDAPASSEVGQHDAPFQPDHEAPGEDDVFSISVALDEEDVVELEPEELQGKTKSSFCS